MNEHYSGTEQNGNNNFLFLVFWTKEKDKNKRKNTSTMSSSKSFTVSFLAAILIATLNNIVFSSPLPEDKQKATVEPSRDYVSEAQKHLGIILGIIVGIFAAVFLIRYIIMCVAVRIAGKNDQATAKVAAASTSKVSSAPRK